MNNKGLAIVGGWLAVGFILLLQITNNYMLVCDWRGGYEPCVIVEKPW